MSLQFVLIAITAILLFVLRYLRRSSSLPTPPWRLPFIGHAHYLYSYGSSGAVKAFEDLYDRYSKDGMLALDVGAEKIVLVGETVVA